MSDRQALLEAQLQKSIREIVLESLSRYGAEKYVIQKASLGLGISDATLYNWCCDLGIDIDDYKQPVAVEEQG